jgi:type IV pilus assembly protein PilM
MALPFLNRGPKRRDQIVAIDLGTRTTKAVYIQRRGESYQFIRYAVMDSPTGEKGVSKEALAEHLKNVARALEPKTKQVTLAIGVSDSLLRNTELPQIPVAEMRTMLKFNTKNYLQQELPDHTFDCFIVPPRSTQKADAAKAVQKYKVWVGAAKNHVVSDMQRSTEAAGLVADQVTLGILGPVNAFEMAEPEMFKNQVVALVDIGFRNSTISILSQGDLVLCRVVGIGGDKLSAGLAEALGVTYAEAEGIKIGMPQEVESSLQPLLSPLGRELRASIDFFEHQEDKAVTEVYISGSAARSEYLVQALQTELLINCKTWNPAKYLQMALPGEQLAELEQIAPQLTVALGAAASAF